MAAYTFRDERDLLWYSTVFSAAERESAYVINGLMHNEVVRLSATRNRWVAENFSVRLY